MSVLVVNGKKSATASRWRRFSLRSLMILMTIIAVIAAWRGNMAIHNRMIARMVAVAEREEVCLDTARFVFGKPLYYTDASHHWYLEWFAVDDVSEVYVKHRAPAASSEVAAAARRGIDLHFSYIENLDDDNIEACIGEKTRFLKIRDSTLAPDLFSRCFHWTRIETIEVADAPLSLESLQAVAVHPSLEWLTILVRAEDLRALDPATCFQSLEALTLSLAEQDSGEYSSFHVKDLNALSKCPRLKSLWLKNTIEEDGVGRIIQILPNLESLYLDCDGWSDDSVDALLRMPKLRRLQLSGGYLSKDAAAKVKQFNQLHGG